MGNSKVLENSGSKGYKIMKEPFPVKVRIGQSMIDKLEYAKKASANSKSPTKK